MSGLLCLETEAVYENRHYTRTEPPRVYLPYSETAGGKAEGINKGVFSSEGL